MNTQNKTIKEILSLYDVILENKNVTERAQNLRNTLKSLGYTEKGSEISSGGEITNEISNIVSEILKEYKQTNPDAKVRITSGNDNYHQDLSYASKHKTGNAIDITIEPYNSKNANDFINIVKKFIQKYPKLGFRDEYTNPSKAATGKHFHLEYGSGGILSPSKNTDTTNSPTDTDTTTGTEPSSFARDIGRSLLQSIGIKESLDYNSLGKKIIVRSGEAIIPKENNSSIKSPVFGVVSSYLNSCNGLTIEFKDDNKISYLNYCGITTKNFRYGQEISKGDVIGYPESDSDVRVTLYNSKGRKERINSNKTSDSSGGIFSLFKTKGNTSKTTNNTTNYNSNNYSQYDSETGKTLIQLKDKLFRVNKKDKLEENINRIKNLL
jgi:hypothetical protein